MQGLYRSNAGSHAGPLSAASTGPVSFWPQRLQWARAGCLYGLRSGSYGLTVYVYGLRSGWGSLTVYGLRSGWCRLTVYGLRSGWCRLTVYGFTQGVVQANRILYADYSQYIFAHAVSHFFIVVW